MTTLPSVTNEEMWQQAARVVPTARALGLPVLVTRRGRERGVFVDVSRFARQANITWQVLVTASVWQEIATIPASVGWQDVTGRLWDVLNMMYWSLRRSRNRDAGELIVSLILYTTANAPERYEDGLLDECPELWTVYYPLISISNGTGEPALLLMTLEERQACGD